MIKFYISFTANRDKYYFMAISGLRYRTEPCLAPRPHYFAAVTIAREGLGEFVQELAKTETSFFV